MAEDSAGTSFIRRGLQRASPAVLFSLHCNCRQSSLTLTIPHCPNSGWAIEFYQYVCNQDILDDTGNGYEILKAALPDNHLPYAPNPSHTSLTTIHQHLILMHKIVFMHRSFLFLSIFHKVTHVNT